MNKRIVGVFAAEYEASRAIEELKRQGCRTEDISIIARNSESADTLRDESGTQAPEGIATGAATGGLLGGLTGLLMGIGALAIPGIGPIIAAGPLAAMLAGAAIGAGSGGLVGGLIGLGIPEEEAKRYDNYVGEGHILVMVDVEGERKEEEVKRIFVQHNSLNSDRFEDIANINTAENRNYDGSVKESDALRAADQQEARNLAQATGTMDAMDTLASERIRNK
ncbi:general stress protein [Paenibacillus sp. FSL R5-0345]|uniref:general stress protein n=1 Tax=Paenibacillus sp. FSL R5-0345 TaxID=1536770 RepID=UPI0009DFC3F3|nr:general stress protein [Paenibacillus sp. FSL R5-0345]